MVIDISTAIIVLATILIVAIFLQTIKNIVIARKTAKVEKEIKKKATENLDWTKEKIEGLNQQIETQKKEVNERYSLLSNHVDYKEKEIKSDLERVKKETNFTIDKVKSETISNITKVKNETNVELSKLNLFFQEQKNSIAEKEAAQNKKNEETRQSIAQNRIDFEELERKQTAENKKILEDLLKQKEELIEVITKQSEKIELLEKKAKELQRKIELFTEIDEDSKQLNVKDDVKLQEQLLSKALGEVSGLSTKESHNELYKSGTIEQGTKEEINLTTSSSSLEETPEGNLESSAEKSFESTGFFEEKELIENENAEEKSDALDEEYEDFLSDEVSYEVFEEDDEEEERETFVSSEVGSSVLDKIQRQAYYLMENTNDNFFITGRAGTGKSFLLRLFVAGTKKKTLKVAPTGIAALNVGGTTIHSVFGLSNLNNLDVDELSKETCKLNSKMRNVLKEVETIIIDEVSMVRADTLDKIEKILRIVNETESHFGGKQILLFGDGFQLPPIVKREEEKYLNDKYGGIYFFDSRSYKLGNFRFVELTTNHRQKGDREFFEILNRIRLGETLKKDIDKLNERVCDDPDALRRVVNFFPYKADVEKLNKKELDRIPGTAREFNLKVLKSKKNQNVIFENVFQAESVLKIKPAALVMLTRNDVEKRWVNGSLAIVSKIYTEPVEREYNGEVHKVIPIEVTIDGQKHNVYPVVWEEREAVYKNGKIEYDVVFEALQYPIMLAYAITIHKSQGMTYSRMACTPKNCFATGQAYVALSRCASLNGLNLLDKLNEGEIKVDQRIIEFYSRSRKQ